MSRSKSRETQQPNDHSVTEKVLGVAATAAMIVGGGFVIGKSIVNIKHANKETSVPAEGQPYRVVHLGDTFEVNGKKVTATNLTELARAADATHPDDIPYTVNMLERELPEGMLDTQIPVGQEFKLHADASIGELVNGEDGK